MDLISEGKFSDERGRNFRRFHSSRLRLGSLDFRKVSVSRLGGPSALPLFSAYRFCHQKTQTAWGMFKKERCTVIRTP